MHRIHAKKHKEKRREKNLTIDDTPSCTNAAWVFRAVDAFGFDAYRENLRELTAKPSLSAPADISPKGGDKKNWCVRAKKHAETNSLCVKFTSSSVSATSRGAYRQRRYLRGWELATGERLCSAGFCLAFCLAERVYWVYSDCCLDDRSDYL